MATDFFVGVEEVKFWICLVEKTEYGEGVPEKGERVSDSLAACKRISHVLVDGARGIFKIRSNDIISASIFC